jgi:hypothetical protein
MRSIEPGVHLSPRAAPWIPGSGFAVRGDGTAWDARNLSIFLHPKIRIFGLEAAEEAEKRRRRSDISA